jgi:hypothetical protein
MKFITSFCIIAFCAAVARASTPTTQPIDVLNYFLQKPEISNHYTIGGVNVHADRDPDGFHDHVFVLDKFGGSDNYEVYKVTPTQLQIRYEVNRPSPAGGSGDWIRKYEPRGPHADPNAGAEWMPRFVTPGQTSCLVKYTVYRYQFDPDIRSYILDAAHSDRNLATFNSVVWATDPWGSNNHTGVKIGRILRLISQWQPEGKIIERYDYARGLGLVNWQWLERISTLDPVAGDSTGKIFHCENGAVYIQSAGSSIDPPSVFKYDLKTRQIGAALPVVLFTSYWKPKLGPQWYVIYRDLSREGTLEKGNRPSDHDYALPEWFTHPNATLSDLPMIDLHP